MTATLKRPKQRAPKYLPSPTEIGDACTVIQRRWSPADRCRRRVGDTRISDDEIALHPDYAWTPPEYFTIDFRTRKPLAVTS